jgi:hypothetical protein
MWKHFRSPECPQERPRLRHYRSTLCGSLTRSHVINSMPNHDVKTPTLQRNHTFHFSRKRRVEKSWSASHHNQLLSRGKWCQSPSKPKSGLKSIDDPYSTPITLPYSISNKRKSTNIGKQKMKPITFGLTEEKADTYQSPGCENGTDSIIWIESNPSIELTMASQLSPSRRYISLESRSDSSRNGPSSKTESLIRSLFETTSHPANRSFVRVIISPGKVESLFLCQLYHLNFTHSSDNSSRGTKRFVLTRKKQHPLKNLNARVRSTKSF